MQTNQLLITTGFKNQYRSGILLGALFLTLLLTVNSFAESVNFFDKLGYRVKQATTVGQTVYVTYNTSNTPGMLSSLFVLPDATQYLYVEIPPGVVKSSVGTEASSWSGTSSGVATATQIGETADTASVTLAGNTPTNGVLYDGSATQPGTATYGIMILIAASDSPTAYTAIYLSFELDDTQTALDNFNAWVTANGGTTSSTNPPTPSTPTNNTDEIYFGDGSASDNSQSEEEQNVDLFAAQTNKSGKAAVLEYMLLQALKDFNYEAGNLPGMIVNTDSFELPGADGALIKFKLDMSIIPAALDDGLSSFKLIAKTVEEIDASILELHFMNGNINNIVTLLPFIHEESELKNSLSNFAGVIEVITEDGWLRILMENDTQISVFFDPTIKPVNPSKSSGDGLEFSNPVDYGYESNDVNKDGTNDVMIIHSGKAQLVLIKAS